MPQADEVLETRDTRALEDLGVRAVDFLVAFDDDDEQVHADGDPVFGLQPLELAQASRRDAGESSDPQLNLKDSQI